MVVSAFPDAGRGPVRGRGEVADVVGLRPGDVPVPDAPVGVVRDAPPADGLPPAVVLAAGAVDAVHAHVVVLGVAAPVFDWREFLNFGVSSVCDLKLFRRE